MKKNSQIHLFLETETLQSLRKQADNSGVSVSELCRQKLGECTQLTKIEIMLEDLNKKLKLTKYKQEVKKW